MIFLIGGAPKTGKTTLAKKLSKVINISWISVDIIRQIARKYTDPSLHEKMFPINTIVKKIPKNNDLLYARYSIQEIIDACQKQGVSCYEAIEIMTISNAEFIIEGHQVTPELVEKLLAKYGKKKLIKAIFLSKTNRKKIVQGFIKNPAPDDWIITATKDRETTFPKIAEMIAQYSAYFEFEVQKYGLELIKTDEDFDAKIQSAISYFLNY